VALPVGHQLAHYEILGLIGRGGMGEVYRARDTQLKRDVAIKVLPDTFASDEQRMKRFAREAEVLASLNHPNIASIYGLERSEGTNALVLELVDGPTLAWIAAVIGVGLIAGLSAFWLAQSTPRRRSIQGVDAALVDAQRKLDSSRSSHFTGWEVSRLHLRDGR
jgi:serine/threonine protein kinase